MRPKSTIDDSFINQRKQSTVVTDVYDAVTYQHSISMMEGSHDRKGVHRNLPNIMFDPFNPSPQVTQIADNRRRLKIGSRAGQLLDSSNYVQDEFSRLESV